MLPPAPEEYFQVLKYFSPSAWGLPLPYEVEVTQGNEKPSKDREWITPSEKTQEAGERPEGKGPFVNGVIFTAGKQEGPNPLFKTARKDECADNAQK